MRSTLTDTHISATELPVSALGSWVNDQPLTVITDSPPDKNSLSKSARKCHSNFVNTVHTHRYRTPVKVIGFIFQTPLQQHAASINFGGFRFYYFNQGMCASTVIFDYKTQYSNGQEN